jgi:hypothetical protein
MPSVLLPAVVTLATLACSAEGQAPLSEWQREWLRGAFERSWCAPAPDLQGLLPNPGDGVPGVAYPPFEGARVEASVPLTPYPGSVMVDGFVRKGDGGRRRVQVYQVASAEQAVLDHLAAQLQEMGWMPYSRGYGVSGLSCTYVPMAIGGVAGRPRKWATISTEYIGREDSPSDTAPPGFRGKGLPFAPRTPGVFTYYLITPD